MLRIVSFVLALSMVSTPALAEEIIMKCPRLFDSNYNFFKYSNPLIGSREVYYRENGGWKKLCKDGDRDVKDRGSTCKAVSQIGDRKFTDWHVLDFVVLTKKMTMTTTRGGQVIDTTTRTDDCKLVN